VIVRRVCSSALVILLFTACGGGSLSVSEYAAEAEELVAEMEARFVSLDADWEAQVPSMEGALEYWEGRLDIRHDFLEGVRALQPPDEVLPMHQSALEVFDRITVADEALAARAATFEAVTEHWQWVDTPEGRTADAVLEEVYDFCRASQEEFDATQGGEALEDVPWISPEVQEVVKVAFGCPPQE
jgi:hypothetical protein